MSKTGAKFATPCPKCGVAVLGEGDDGYKKHCDNEQCTWSICHKCGWTFTGRGAFSSKEAKTVWPYGLTKRKAKKGRWGR